MDTAATAARLNLTENNVKRRLHLARLALSAKLEPLMAGEAVRSA